MSDRWFIVNPIFPALLSLGIIVVLSGIFCWLEIRRSIRLLPLRIVVLLCMMLSVFAMIVRPSFLSSQSNSIALLTPGYDPEKIDSLLNTGEISLMHVPEATSYKNSSLLDSHHSLPLITGEIDYVFGQGLPAHALDILKDRTFHFFPSDFPAGIISLTVQKPVFRDRKNKIEGVFNNREAKTKLLLEGPGGIEDSVVISAKDFSRFQLAFTARKSGNISYTLISIDSTGKELREVLPITVSQQEPSDILFIQNYPSFETQYLKNFLAKQHRVLLRYQLSKNTYRYESINQKQQRIGKLSESSLIPFDLILIDTDALRSLASDEVNNLQRAIRNGLGMIILLNDRPQNIRQLKPFLSAEFKALATDTAHVQILNSKKIFSAWPVQIRSKELIHPVIKNKTRTLSGYSYMGFGKVGFQLLQETYHLVLEGDSSSYGTIWSELIEQTSRVSKKQFAIIAENPFPVYQDEPVNTTIISANQPPEVLGDGISIAPAEDLFIDDVWHVKTWAGDPGWHTLMIAEDSTSLDYYVAEENSWKALRIASTINQTALRSASVQGEKSYVEIIKPIPPLIFYLVFLICAGLLWLIPKL